VVGDWALSAEVTDLSLDSFLDLFAGVLGGDLDDFAQDIEFSDVTLNISPDGISLEGVLSVDGYTSLDATVAVDESGLDINGAIDNVTIGDVTLQQASINFFAGHNGTISLAKGKRPTAFAIMGTVDFGPAIQISASLYLETTDDGTTKWTIYGEYDKALSTGTLSQSLQATNLDLPMTNVAFLAGNADTAVAGFVNQFNYPIIKGRWPL
jgi:hypothetical protein